MEGGDDGWQAGMGGDCTKDAPEGGEWGVGGGE